MPKFYFHIRDGGALIRDEFSELNAARVQATNSAKEMIGELGLVGNQTTNQSFEV